MKAIKSLVVAAVAVTGVALAAGAQAATNGLARGGSWSGSHGGGQWSGSAGGHGNWSGGHWNGGHWNGGHWSGGHWRGGWWGPRFSFFIGAPLVWPAYYWGYPYYYDWYSYPRTVYVERYPMSTPDDAATTEAPAGPGAPTQGPAYLNYCESAKAYYPKVTSCPEGWKFLPAQPRR